jgi:hypothetical protein
MTNLLPPVLVFGTGLTRQLLGDGGESKHHKPLICWHGLLQEVAEGAGVPNLCKSGFAEKPILLWEEMVRACVAKSVGGREGRVAAANAEKKLKGVAAKILTECAEESRKVIKSAEVSRLIENLGPHVVSLNFDDLVFRGRATRIPSSPALPEIRRIDVVSSDFGKIWHPHGCVARPDSIRLGLREYGFLPQMWDARFRRFKAFERDAARKCGFDNIDHGATVRFLVEREVESEDDIIFQLMLAPLIFFGVGLRGSEWGLWWVLNQRARNLARISERDRPPTVIVRHHVDEDSCFWRSHPADVRPIFVADWEQGWKVMIEWLAEQKYLACR